GDFDMLDVELPEEDVRRARRAYYGSISYIDAMIGQILDALSAADLAEDTVIIFTSDHGEMLGERGMWFKKHFFEPSLRIPLILKIPGRPSQRVRTPASLVDLLPTFMGVADGAGWSSAVEELDGEDLLSYLDADTNADRPIFAEYLAEATTAPIFMIRRGRYKFIGSADDPPLLFDVAADADERINLANDPEHKGVLSQFESEAAQKWNSERLSEDIRLSQRRRLLVMKGAPKGPAPRWNHDEDASDEVLWYRGEGGYNDWAFNYLPVRGSKS
ncbi:MAG: sulfatase-like hydrolase/transferase, partial [Pseudomonadota bacterium]